MGIGNIVNFPILISPKPIKNLKSSESFKHESWKPELFESQVMGQSNRPKNRAE